MNEYSPGSGINAKSKIQNRLECVRVFAKNSLKYDLSQIHSLRLTYFQSCTSRFDLYHGLEI